MHMKANNKDLGPEIVPVKFILEDPEPLTGDTKKEIELKAAIGESVLELALDHGINIEHACGGVTACSTCNGLKGKRLPEECGMVPFTRPVEPTYERLQSQGRLILPDDLHESWADFLA